MMKRTAIALIFASQAGLAIAQSAVNPEDSGYLGGWLQSDLVATAPRAEAAPAIAANPEDSGYLGGWAQEEASRTQATIPARAPATPAMAVERLTVNPEDSGYRGPGV